jgi:methyl-accepting chemotaxis protein
MIPWSSDRQTSALIDSLTELAAIAQRAELELEAEGAAPSVESSWFPLLDRVLETAGDAYSEIWQAYTVAVQQTRPAFQPIGSSVDDISDRIDRIAAAAGEIAGSVQELSGRPMG